VTISYPCDTQSLSLTEFGLVLFVPLHVAEPNISKVSLSIDQAIDMQLAVSLYPQGLQVWRPEGTSHRPVSRDIFHYSRIQNI
jgi:hypothetical protein